MYESSTKKRVIFIAAILLLLFSVLGGKLAWLHLGNHSKLSGRDYKMTTPALRGTIYDRYGKHNPLVMSLTARLYFFDHETVDKKHDLEHIIAVMAEALELDPAETAAKMRQPKSRYVKLGVTSDSDVYERLKQDDISGVSWEPVVERRYPHNRLMSHVLGFVNKLGQGSAGVEQQYDRYLEGTPGLIEGTKDGGRRELIKWRKTYVEPLPGDDIYLTLDHNIQYVVERELREVVEKFEADAGWVIVQLVKTGEILAMASLPDFAPGAYNEYTQETWRNNALAIVYEPGSVLKAITVAAALNEGLVTPQSLFDVGQQGYWVYAGRPLRDHVFGQITVATALKKSSNIACARMGLMLGNRRMEAYLRAFNFGAKLGFDLPGEERGILARGKEWERDKLKLVRVPIGQGIAVTGLQLVNAFTTLANDGRMLRPHLIKRIVAPNGTEVYRAQPEVIGRPVRPEVARAVRTMLQAVTEEGGTGRRAAVSGYTVAGKTGTAQKAIPGGYSHTDYYASFVGFVPAQEPVFTVLVTIERPRPQHTGGFVAAPVFAAVATAAARYLEVAPDMPELEELD